MVQRESDGHRSESAEKDFADTGALEGVVKDAVEGLNDDSSELSAADRLELARGVRRAGVGVLTTVALLDAVGVENALESRAFTPVFDAIIYAGKDRRGPGVVAMLGGLIPVVDAYVDTLGESVPLVAQWAEIRPMLVALVGAVQ